MSPDLWLQQQQPGDLRLARDRTSGGDLWLQQPSPGDLTLTRPSDRSAALQGQLPAIACGITATVEGISSVSLHGALPELQSQIAAAVEGVSSAALHGILPPLQSQLSAEYAANAQLHAALPALASQMAAAYDNAVWRGMAARNCGVWQPGQAQSPTTSAEFGQTARLRAQARAPWEPGANLPTPIAALFGPLTHQPAAVCAPCEDAEGLRAEIASSFTVLTPRHLASCAPWQAAQPLHTGACVHWIDLLRTERPIQCGIYQEATLLSQRWHSGYTHALRAWREYCWAWDQGALREGWGGAIAFPEPAEPAPDPCRIVGQADLTLVQYRDGALVLRDCLPATARRTRYLPIYRVYLVSDSATLTRVSDGAAIPTQSLQIAIDVDSWAWALSATLAGPQTLALIQQTSGGPVEVEATINGTTWRALIDSWRHSRGFGNRSITIQGRSLAAYLAAPYSHPRSRTESQTRDAQQLAIAELPGGWTLDWQIEDWRVPGGAWSYSERTPIEAIAALAKAAGGYVQAGKSSQTLHLLKRYPTPRWDWPGAAPALSIPTHLITELGRDWQPTQEANRIYISGQSQGVLVGVRRAGSAGDKPLPMIVDPLVTEVSVGRERGIAELSATGEQSRERLSLPVSIDTQGVIDTGTLISVTGDGADWRGIVRAVSVSAQREGNALRVRQELDIERHAA